MPFYLSKCWAFVFATSLLLCPDLSAFLCAKTYHFFLKKQTNLNARFYYLFPWPSYKLGYSFSYEYVLLWGDVLDFYLPTQ